MAFNFLTHFIVAFVHNILAYFIVAFAYCCILTWHLFALVYYMVLICSLQSVATHCHLLAFTIFDHYHIPAQFTMAFICSLNHVPFYLHSQFLVWLYLLAISIFDMAWSCTNTFYYGFHLFILITCHFACIHNTWYGIIIYLYSSLWLLLVHCNHLTSVAIYLLLP